MKTLILGSGSPRRKQILDQMGIPCTVCASPVDETYPENMDVEKVAEYLARKKVSGLKDSGFSARGEWILGADTVIVHNGRIFGKPKDRKEAYSFIEKLQGRTHKVLTGVALLNGETGEISSRTSTNLVTFKQMSIQEIEWYIASGEWKGVAGAYRIQGKGSCFISSISGSESSVMGLPISELYDMLKEQNFLNTELLPGMNGL